MFGNKLFLRRFIWEFQYQWRVICSILDWSIMLYIAIPALVIIPFFYADFWQNIHIYWDARISLALLLTLLLFLSNCGHIRTYLLYPDLLFLIQKKRVIYQLKRNSFLIPCFFFF